MKRYIQIILLILLGLSYIEPHLKLIRLVIQRIILSLLNRVIRRIRRLWVVIVLAIMGALSLINMSGYANLIQSNDKTFYFLLIVGVVISYKKMNPQMTLKKKDFFHGFVLFAFFWLVPWAAGFGSDGIRYMSFYLCIYIVSKMYINDEDMLLIHWIYCVLATIILAIAQFGTKLDGWNNNTLAIVALQLLMVFMITHKKGNKKQDRLFVAIIIFEFIMMISLASRGAELSMLLSMLLMKRWERLDRLLTKKVTIFIIVIIPLILAVGTVMASKLPFVEALNDWSIRQFRKPIFNGRDEIWENSFIDMTKPPLRLFIGSGFINSGWYHNSAVACLSSYGIIGYILYVMTFYKILCKGIPYWKDDFVRKCMIMFYIICLEQSMENTIFQAATMITTPYIILGMMLSRINQIKGVVSATPNNWDIVGMWNMYESWKMRRAEEKELDLEEEEERIGERRG